MRKVIQIFLLIFIFSPLAVAQTPATTKSFNDDSTETAFFPYRTGDFWVQELYIMGIYDSDEHIKVTTDTLDSVGIRVYTLKSSIWGDYHYRIDTLGSIYSDFWGGIGNWFKILEVDKQKNESWIVAKTHVYELAQVQEIYYEKIFTDSTKLIEVLYATVNDSLEDIAGGFPKLNGYWTERFGLLRYQPLELGGIEQRLKGAYINGVVYGDTTTKKLVHNEFSEEGLEQEKFFKLQNYPNPFNSTTNFVIRIGNQNRFSLSIYNQVGQLVTTIFDNKVLSKGIYTFSWVGDNMPTGIYFARLSSMEGVKVQVITLIK